MQLPDRGGAHFGNIVKEFANFPLVIAMPHSFSAKKISVLLIEDESLARQVMAQSLRDHGFIVEEAEDGTTGLGLALQRPFDAVVLDLALPGATGLEIVKELRLKSRVPVLFVSQTHLLDTRLEVLEAGADDFLIKPVDLKELRLRLTNLVVRSNEPSIETVIQIGDLELDPNNRIAKLSGIKLEFSSVEFDLLHYLARHPGRLVSRPQLDQEIFNRDPQLQTKSNMLDVYILRLRRKLGSDRIVTHRGLGFSLHG